MLQKLRPSYHLLWNIAMSDIKKTPLSPKINKLFYFYIIFVNLLNKFLLYIPKITALYHQNCARFSISPELCDD